MLIIRFFKDKFKIYHSDNFNIPDSIEIEDECYFIDDNSKVNKGFLGFFDWLRIDENAIVGIRICYFENQSYNETLSELPYLRSAFNKKCFELLFANNDRYDFDLSGDQDFTNNYVYVSSTGNYLFMFGTDQLTEKELISLMHYCNPLII